VGWVAGRAGVWVGNWGPKTKWVKDGKGGKKFYEGRGGKVDAEIFMPEISLKYGVESCVENTMFTTLAI
jgi:hypothetical protein